MLRSSNCFFLCLSFFLFFSLHVFSVSFSSRIGEQKQMHRCILSDKWLQHIVASQVVRFKNRNLCSIYIWKNGYGVVRWRLYNTGGTKTEKWNNGFTLWWFSLLCWIAVVQLTHCPQLIFVYMVHARACVSSPNVFHTAAIDAALTAVAFAPNQRHFNIYCNFFYFWRMHVAQYNVSVRHSAPVLMNLRLFSAIWFTMSQNNIEFNL